MDINIEALINYTFNKLCWFKLSQALSKVDGTSGGIAVMFNDSGFWFKAQVEKSQGHLSKELIIKSHCYTIFG